MCFFANDNSMEGFFTAIITAVAGLAFGTFAFLSAKVAAAPKVKFALLENFVGIPEYNRGVTDFPYAIDVSPSLPTEHNIKVLIDGCSNKVNEEIYRGEKYFDKRSGTSYRGHFHLKGNTYENGSRLEVLIKCRNSYVGVSNIRYLWIFKKTGPKKKLPEDGKRWPLNGTWVYYPKDPKKCRVSTDFPNEIFIERVAGLLLLVLIGSFLVLVFYNIIARVLM